MWLQSPLKDRNFPPLTTENRSPFVDAIHNFADKFNVILFSVPTQGTGVLDPLPSSIAGKNLANYQILNYVDILDNDRTELKSNKALKYLH